MMEKLQLIFVVVLLRLLKADSVSILTFGHMVCWYGKFFLEGFNHLKMCSTFHRKTGDGIEKIIDQICMIIQVKIQTHTL